MLCLGAAALLFAYAFVHYDAETEANTYQVTTHLTDYALFTSRHGGITLQLSTEAGVFYYDVFYDSSPWNAVKEEERALTETLQPLADCRAEITVVVSDEKNYAYVTSYGLDALQAVEVRDAEGIFRATATIRIRKYAASKRSSRRACCWLALPHTGL